MIKKTFGKCVSACLIVALTLSLAVPAFAWEDEDNAWDDFDASAPIPAAPEPEPEPPPPPPPMYTEPEPDFSVPPQTFEPPPEVEAPPPTWGSTAPPPPPEPEPEIIGTQDLEELFKPSREVAEESEGFIRVVRHRRQGDSETQNAVIEGLQVSVDPGEDGEVNVTCYFIFRDRPTSFFYDINRKDKRLVFDFVDTRTGSAPVAAIRQSPIRSIVIEELQTDANKDIKGLNPEWHDVIRITFQLEHLPVISVNNEHNIISFSYKWTTDPEKIMQYLEPNRFPLVFWISGGTLGGIGLGVLTYFLVKKPPVINNRLSDRDLPNRVQER